MKVQCLASWALGFGFVLLTGIAPGCNCNQSETAFHRDLSGFGVVDLSVGGGGGDAAPINADAFNACGDTDPSCTVVSAGPSGTPSMPFPLPTDNPPPANVNADGVDREPTTGYLVLNSSHANFDFLWVADDTDYGIGFISKISTKPRTPPPGAWNKRYVEVARYVSVTCYSDSTMSNGPDRTMVKLGQPDLPGCDGTKGCCDNAPAGTRKPVQLINNHPSRTAVDYNGDMWVANRAHIESPHQSSVTKIANKNDSNPANSDCIDRNGNGKIDTSSDANNDGIIDTDCNDNGTPDDLIDTANGTNCRVINAGTGERAKQEFFGLDDECILFTTDTGPENGWGRPLALGKGSNGDFGPSDAWAGRFMDGTFYRINGKTGFIQTSVTLPAMPVANNTISCNQPDDCQPGYADNWQCVSNKCLALSHPYGAAIDQFGVLWAPNVYDFNLFYFDTNDPNNTAKMGVASPPTNFGYTDYGFYGISMDGYSDPITGALIQQVWLGHYGTEGGTFRYRPMRTTNPADLAGGSWAWVKFTGAPNYDAANGRGVAVDNRNPANVWVGLDTGNGGVGRVDANVLDGVSNSMHVFRADDMLGNNYAGTATIGVGVANDLDIWAVNNGDSSLTHYSVGANADLSPADKIDLNDHPSLAGGLQPHPYTYSDFTGFGLRNFTNPRGYYQWTQAGCGDGVAGKTKWLKVVWDADVPPNTAVEVKVRSADDQTTLNMTPFSAPYTMSPADLQALPALMPNPSGYLQVEFDLSTTQKDITPKLKGFQILYECENGIS